MVVLKIKDVELFLVKFKIIIPKQYLTHEPAHWPSG